MYVIKSCHSDKLEITPAPPKRNDGINVFEDVSYINLVTNETSPEIQNHYSEMICLEHFDNYMFCVFCKA